MNRREFTKGLAAAGLTPALPLPSLAATGQAAVAAKDSMYVWANFITRVHNKCSPEMLSRLLKVDAGHGAKLYAQLLADGAISAPNAYGISKATEPLYQQFATVTGHGSKVAATAEPSDNSKLLDKVMDDDAGGEEDVTEDAPDEPDLHAQEQEECDEFEASDAPEVSETFTSS